MLPGSANPCGSDEYKQAYALIEKEAQRLGCIYRLVKYPGCGTDQDGQHSYETAVSASLKICRQFRPNRIIARSTGCDVAAGILSSGDDWVAQVTGAVLWGPMLKSVIERNLPTDKERQAEIERYRTYNVFIARDFFETLPSLEENIRGARCNLQFVRGTFDKGNSRADLDVLASNHRHSQPSFRQKVIEMEGLRHTVVPADLSPKQIRGYLDCLFDSF
jgi:hypothetical protein